ncbi:penicillin-binding protein 2 [Chelonobacter oris]|uniref:Peptidoglycan D,D-transpeptidase MrdA n=1 Tax=Chelonobacter oris TaxID=505317 RepID=A0A0A3B8H7_9PAST|nr:penicillin-binding protein 2 [Chelonobacter oris]KGQ69899.1 penicillin-binding protein 2 [Chelonobacter oris]MDH2999264.1 penicillin-binding protein 2 [Chelonobacter oris]
MAKEIIRDNKAEQNLFLRRVLVAFIGVLLLLSVLLLNNYNLQVRDYDNYQTRSNGNRIKLLPVAPTRGLIYDRNNRVLAENLTFFGLYIVPEKTENLQQTYDELRQIVGLSDEDIEAFTKERRRNSRYTPILLKSDLTEEQIARFSVNQHLFPSLEIRPYFKRHYPYGEDLTHILGYVAKINDKDVERLKEEDKLANYAGTGDIGKLGIERYYEEQLHGEVGFEEVEVNNRGKVIRTLRQQPAVSGKSIKLTIDLTLQRYIRQLLDGRRGAVVVLDPRDNSILAMVSSPSYDNNLFVGGISSANYNALLNNPERPLYSRTTQGAFPPASTVKPFIAVAALQDGIITTNSTIYDPGYWVLPGTDRRYRDWLRSGHGRLNLNKAIMESADTYFYQLIYDMGINRFSDWMKRFGFGMPTGVDIREETSGVMPTREWKQQRYKKPWVIGDTIPVGIGQGYWTATPLQLTKALSVLINNGRVDTPHFMQEVIGNETQPYQDPKLYDDISGVPQAYWNAAKAGMYSVLYGNTGTAKKAFSNMSYLAAGKSGTAQVFGLKENQKYDASNLASHLHDHAWFIAYAPYNNPTIALSVFLENAGGGSSQAAPIARSIMDYYLLNMGNLQQSAVADNLKQTDKVVR